MSRLFEALNDTGECGIPEKIAGKKERGPDFIFFQRLPDERSAIGVFMPGKDEGDLFLRAVAPGYGPAITAQSPFGNGGYRFFGRLSASFAASR